MSVTVVNLAQTALTLPPDQRLELARQLLQSVELEPEPGAEAAWQTEIARRIALVESGQAETIPATEVFARLRRIAPGR